MSCRNPIVDDCMDNDTQSYTEIFSNENSNDSGYWSDYQETPKIYGKHDYPSESLCNACYADCQKVSVFFSKLVEFKPISGKLKFKFCANLIFSNSIVF